MKYIVKNENTFSHCSNHCPYFKSCGQYHEKEVII